MDWNVESEEGGPVNPSPEEGNQVNAAPKETTRHKLSLIVMSAVATLVIVAAIGGFGFFLGHDVVKTQAAAVSAGPSYVSPYFPSGSTGNYPPTVPASSGGSTAPTQTPADTKIATAVDPGLVDITTQLSYEGATAAGTGMIVSSNGLVLTNNHVIDGATSISARDVATNTVYTATVVGYDATSDVAVLQLQNASGLTTVTTGNSNTVKKNENVIGIGNAGGVGGTPSYAAGSVVALNQSITASDEGSLTDSEQLTNMIEINADVQPGDSGGPLVNSKGHVIGMDTAGSSGSANPSFGQSSTTATTTAYAIPINTALAIAKSIENGNSSSTVHVGTTAFLGIEVGSSYASGVGGVPSTTANGVVIDQTIPGSPAAGSALTAGDVIVSVNGESVTTPSSLSTILATFKSGDTVQIGYDNLDGVRSTLSLQLAAGPPQ